MYSWFLQVEWNLQNFNEEIDHRTEAYTKTTDYLFSMTFKGSIDEDSNNGVGINPSKLQGVNEGGLNRSHGPEMWFCRRLSRRKILIKRDDSIPPEELLLDVLADLMVLFMFLLREPNGQHYPSATLVGQILQYFFVCNFS